MRSWRSGVLAIVAIAVAACSGGDRALGPHTPDPLVQRLVALGFRRDMIVDRGEYFVVEGDIRIDKADLRRSSRRPSRIRDQWATNNLASQPGTITVDVSALAGSPWQAAATNAMKNWNALPGTSVTFTQATPGQITLTLFQQPCGFGTVIACAAFPTSTGAVGNSIVVNPNFASFLNASQMLFALTHELGHTIGFRHTNWQALGESAGSIGANLIAGTPQTDGNSIMNGHSSSPGDSIVRPWAGFSASDTTAAMNLYPSPTAVTVSNVGGHVNVAFSATRGALSHTVEWVRFIHTRRDFQSPFVNSADSVAETTTTAASFLTPDAFTGFSICDITDQFGGETRWTDEYHVSANYPGGRRNTTTVDGQNIPLTIVNGKFQGNCT
jgi:hypothetical protein